MAKEIKYGNDAREKAVDSLRRIADVIGATVGPAGRPILLTRQLSATNSTVFHTKDGITVLRELSYTDPVMDAVHKIALQATTDTVAASGDGTTSTLIVASAFAQQLLRGTNNNPQAAIRSFRKEVVAACDAIAGEVQYGEEAEKAVALTSTNGDEELTQYIRKAIEKTSAYGTVLVEKNPLSKERFMIDKEYGYQAGNGYNHNITLGISVSDQAVTNGEFFLKKSVVIPYNGNLTQVSQISPILECLYAKMGGSFNALIVCYEVSDDVCNALIVTNRKNPNVKVFVTKTTPTAELNGAWNQLNDIAAFTGATVVDAGLVSRWSIEDSGVVETVRVGPYKTFISGKSPNNWIVKRAEQNQTAIQLAPTQIDRDIISSRNASLTGGLVKLIIGGGLPGDIHEIADRADDAIRASQACRRSGALPGCGLSFIRAGKLADVSVPVQNALESVHSQIMENYGRESIGCVDKGATLAIKGDRFDIGNFLTLGVADSYETIKSVMMNGFALGSLVANLGGYCLNADLDEIQKQMMLKDVLLG